MATRSIVPRADGEGSVGTSAKKWGGVWAQKVNGNDPETLLHPRKNSTAYVEGDVAFAVSAPSSVVLVCADAGTTAATEPDFSSVEIGDTATDGTVTWRCQSIVGGDGLSIGMVAPFLQTSIPDGWLSCENGQVVLRSAYPELWAWVQSNAPLITEAQWQTKASAQKSVGYYSSGDGSTTFRLPRLVGFMEGTTAANVGAFTAAGLPNITGAYAGADRLYTGTSAIANGAFGMTQAGNFVYGDASSAPSAGSLTFDASRSSAIYGNSNTVQPESVGMVWCVRAFGAAVNQGTVDITELAQMLNLKLSIVDAPAVCTPLAFPSHTFVQYPYVDGGVTLTAPANGWFAIGCVTAVVGAGVVGIRATDVLYVSSFHGQAGASIGVLIPVPKNDVWTFYATEPFASSFSSGNIAFIYAQGEV